MVAQQVLVLFVVVRIRLGQRKKSDLKIEVTLFVSNVASLLFPYPTATTDSLGYVSILVVDGYLFQVTIVCKGACDVSVV